MRFWLRLVDSFLIKNSACRLQTIKSHTSFINDLQFSPDGELLASVGADGKVFLYDGAEGEQKASAGDRASGSLVRCSHASIRCCLLTFSFHYSQYSLSFSPDSTALATSSAASVVQIYDATTLNPTRSFNLSGSSSDATSSQQLGVTYLTPSTLASVSLSGVINLLDTRAPDQSTSLYGPTRGITASGLSETGKGKTFWVGSFDGGVKSFVYGKDAIWEDVAGSGHKGQVVGFAANKKGGVATTAWDDSVKEITPQSGFTYVLSSLLARHHKVFADYSAARFPGRRIFLRPLSPRRSPRCLKRTSPPSRLARPLTSSLAARRSRAKCSRTSAC